MTSAKGTPSSPNIFTALVKEKIVNPIQEGKQKTRLLSPAALMSKNYFPVKKTVIATELYNKLMKTKCKQLFADKENYCGKLRQLKRSY